MDTPEKKPQPSPSLLSTFQDSPLFNYINNLSPIMPFNLSRSGQSFNGLGFALPQYVKISPQTNCPDESSKIKSGTHVSDVPKNNCSQNGSEEPIPGISGAVARTALHNKESDKSDSIRELTITGTNESSKRVIELPESYKHYSGSSPENSVVHCGAEKPDCEPNMAVREISPTKVMQEVPAEEVECSFEDVMSVQGTPQVCNWEKFIYDSDILNCQTPAKDKHHEEVDKTVDCCTPSFVPTLLQHPNENFDGTQNSESVSSPHMSIENQGVEAAFSQPNETIQVPGSKESALLAEEVIHYSSTEAYGKQQMASRRCLVYEMSGAHYRQSSDPASPNLFNEKGEVAIRPGGSNFSSSLPGIGLHLNALAAASREKIVVKRQFLTCRRQLISSPCTTSSVDALTSDIKLVSTPMPPHVAGMSCDEQKDANEVTGNVDQNSLFGEGNEFHHSSPKKKRRKSENVGDNDYCKRCNCIRSKCLKLYCECFAAGLYCVEPCNCRDCFNKPIHEETVLETRRQIESRNPIAFAPKVIRCSSTPHNGDELNTPASARHKSGCNCKKSGCLKKYCECFQGGVGCSLGCRCEGCKNTFGQKEGITFEESHIFDKSAIDASSHNKFSGTGIENQVEQATPEPSNNIRQFVRRPFDFDGMDSQFPSTQKTVTSDETAIEEELKIVLEDEGDYSLPTCVKSTSPNSKRVSPPPHYDVEPSPGWKSRKLILRSIPSFPTSITEKKAT